MMKILILSWEYPPRIVGGLSRHVYWLSRSIAELGHEVVVGTLSNSRTTIIDENNNLLIIRVDPYAIPSPDFISWVHQFNQIILEHVIETTGLDIDIIHAHDWLVARSGIILKHLYRKPLIVTIHSTEYGRRNGLHNIFERHIHEVEWFLTYEAWKVIVCSNYMRNEVRRIFNVPRDKIYVIPNGVNPIRKMGKNEITKVLEKYNIPWDKKIVLFVGRLVYEKGAHILVESIPRILRVVDDVFFVFVGTGPMEEYLIKRTDELGVKNRTVFTGFVSDDELHALYNAAYVAVFPSLYEPFGIVALEAMSIGKPVIVSNTGGLSEIVEHGKNGLKVPPGDIEALANAIIELLLKPETAERMGKAGYEMVYNKYTWHRIAEQTLNVYRKVLDEYNIGTWKPRLIHGHGYSSN